MGPLEGWCLKTLYRDRRAFINFDDLIKRGMDKKALEKSLKFLENEGFVRKKLGSKSSKFRYGLVNKRMKEIIEILKIFHPEYVRQ